MAAQSPGLMGSSLQECGQDRARPDRDSQALRGERECRVTGRLVQFRKKRPYGMPRTALIDGRISASTLS